uniref:RNase H type-1 domain-containing protein n=1 Tax=Strongyloides stercoralis TaxID=6248 RepID=A0A0K0DU29_STRER
MLQRDHKTGTLAVIKSAIITIWSLIKRVLSEKNKLLIKRSIKEAEKLNYTTPCITTFDVDPVLNYINNFPIREFDSLKEITEKFLFLLLLTTSQRVSEIANLDITYMTILPDEIFFIIPTRCKNSTKTSPLHKKHEIDIQSANEIRKASSSKAYYRGVNVCDVVNNINWAHSNTFFKHYLKEIKKDSYSKNVLSLK